MLAMAVRNTKKLVRERSASDNVRLGRFFTKKEVAFRMTSLLSFVETKQVIEVLDPGAGTGILSAAILEAICLGRTALEVHLVCYENNEIYIPMLKNNLERLRKKCKREHDVKVKYEIREENFLLSSAGETFDVIIMNPPRDLIPKESSETEATGDVLTSPKIDTAYLFLATSVRRLKDEGQLVTLMPTSFATGVTLGALREHVFGTCRMTGMHLYLSDKGLKKEFLFSLLKTDEAGEPITVTTSRDGEEGEIVEKLPPLPYRLVVRDGGTGLLLLREKGDLAVLRRMAGFPCRFSGYGLHMRTGLTLPSRYPELLSDKPEPGAVPLIHPRSLGMGRVTFPAKGLHGQFIKPSIPSLIQKNRNMIFLKRFPAKSDKRRLMCSVYMASQAGGYRYISTHNKLNYIDRDGEEMDAPFLVGIFAVLSSSLYDKYVRLISRSEQVNATELSDLPLPDENTLRSIGSSLLAMRRLEPEICDTIFESKLENGK